MPLWSVIAKHFCRMNYRVLSMNYRMLLNELQNAVKWTTECGQMNYRMLNELQNKWFFNSSILRTYVHQWSVFTHSDYMHKVLPCTASPYFITAACLNSAYLWLQGNTCISFNRYFHFVWVMKCSSVFF